MVDVPDGAKSAVWRVAAIHDGTSSHRDDLESHREREREREKEEEEKEKEEKEEEVVFGTRKSSREYIFDGDILADAGLGIYRLVPFSAWQ